MKLIHDSGQSPLHLEQRPLRPLYLGSLTIIAAITPHSKHSTFESFFIYRLQDFGILLEFSELANHLQFELSS